MLSSSLRKLINRLCQREGAGANRIALSISLPPSAKRIETEAPFHNADFLWPVVDYLTTYLRSCRFSAGHINLPHLSAGELAARLRANSIRAIAITTTLYVSLSHADSRIGEAVPVNRSARADCRWRTVPLHSGILPAKGRANEHPPLDRR